MIDGLEHWVEALAALVFVLLYLSRFYNETKKDHNDLYNRVLVVAALIWMISCAIALHRAQLTKVV